MAASPRGLDNQTGGARRIFWGCVGSLTQNDAQTSIVSLASSIEGCTWVLLKPISRPLPYVFIHNLAGVVFSWNTELSFNLLSWDLTTCFPALLLKV